MSLAEALEQAGTEPAYRELDANTFLDSVIFAEGAWHRLPQQDYERIRERVIREAYRRHYFACGHYRRYCQRLGVGPELEELARIPVLSARAFKQFEILSTPSEDVEGRFQSSGTSGQASVVGRDRITLERLIGSVESGMRLVGDWAEDELTIINLGSADDTHVWFQYVMTLTEMKHPSHHMERSGLIDWPATVRCIEAALKAGSHTAIVGPPFYVLELCEHLERSTSQVHGGADITVLTAGGWKRRAREMIDRDAFRARISRSLQLDSLAQVRDAFSQVELNTVFFECIQGSKHVPPWVYVAARDPRTMRVLADAEVGLLSYVDASAHSYPAMILAEDLGSVRRSGCACGVAGETVSIERRIATTPARGCALTMEAGRRA